MRPRDTIANSRKISISKMARQLVVGNWKMNGSLEANRELLEAVLAGVREGGEVAVCVPFPYLPQVAGLLADGSIAVGAQDVSEHESGAYTGQVSAAMLREFACRYVIVGHSERRTLLHESDAEVAGKALAAVQARLTPIVCVGESLQQRDAGEVEAVIVRQLDALAQRLSRQALAAVVIAYEPVWAIGSGRSASPQQVQEVLALIRAWLTRHCDDAARVRVLYGGSVKAAAAAELFALPDCDGGLIGGASLQADEFVAICRAAAGRAV